MDLSSGIKEDGLRRLGRERLLVYLLRSRFLEDDGDLKRHEHAAEADLRPLERAPR